MITRDPEGFLNGVAPSGARYLDLMGNMLVHVLDKEDEEVAGAEALKLLEVMFQNCSGAIDGLVPVSIGLVLKRLAQLEQQEHEVGDPNFKVLLYTTIGNILFYNPALALRTCEEQGVTDKFVGSLFEVVKKEDVVKRIYDRKQLALGLSSLLRLPVAEMPQKIASMVPELVVLNISLLHQINEQLCAKFERAEKKKEGGGADDDVSGALPTAFNDRISFIRNDEDDDEEALVRQIQGSSFLFLLFI